IVTVGPNGGIASIVPSGTTQPIFTGGPSNWSVINTEDEIPPRPDAEITKTLRMPEGTPIPTATFEFEFDPVRVRLTDAPDPITYSREVADFEALLARYHTLGLDSFTTTTTPGTPPAAGNTYITGTLNLGVLLDAITFPGDGVFVWNVREVAGSSNTASPSYMTYDEARFQIRVYVDGGNIAGINVYLFDYTPGSGYALVKQTEGPNFLNTYRRNTSLGVTKEIYAPDSTPDTSTLFSFTLALTPHTLAPLNFPLSPPIEAIIIGSDGNPVAGPRSPVEITGASTTFELMHGESISIPSLPIGTVFNVTEAAHVEFAPSVTVTLGGTEAHTDERTFNTALPTGNHALGNGGNAADFVNTHRSPVESGLIFNNLLIIPLALGVLATAVFLSTRARKRAENMPLV
ncbi:MAG: hypothetical protein FWE48_03650, partial [Coriobacteriia bacterium]|nr:hypothetical protein [Coriobacteriia bacterium]